MLTLDRIADTIIASCSKREVAETLGVTASNISCRLHTGGPPPGLLQKWQALPPDGAFRGHSASIPKAIANQAEWDALVAEAVADHPLDPSRSRSWNVARLLWSLYAITGTLTWSRGWVRACLIAVGAAGLAVPSAQIMRWHRSTLRDSPEVFAGSCPDDGLMQDLLAQYI